MAEVEFDTDNQYKTVSSPSIGIVRAENRMAEWLMRKGIAKNERHAQLVLLGVAGTALLMGVMSWFWLSPQVPPPPSQEEIDAAMYPAARPAVNSATSF